MLKTISYLEWLKQEKNTVENTTDQLRVVQDIIKDVKERKDEALFEYTKRFDKATLNSLKVTEDEINKAFEACDKLLIEDLKRAYNNIALYHEKQLKSDYTINVTNNSYVGQIIKPIQEVGIYVPGGTAAYPSTVLMNAVPAKIAGVKRIVMISPPTEQGEITPIILVAAKIAGVTEIYKVGGAQGIAALAFGTESINRVSKIVGPGNIYVALAKREVFGTVGIDMIAGPSEILIYADQTSNPKYIAADLLSQAEHDTLARPLLVTTSKDVIESVNNELSIQLKELSRQKIAQESIVNYGAAILVDNEQQAIDVMNQIAPEHLELLNENRNNTITSIQNAGAIFLGPYSPEPLGDYMAGPNHTLPTSGTATFSSALSVDDFITKTSVISYAKEDLESCKDSIMRIANEEGLTAHANAIKVRFDYES